MRDRTVQLAQKFTQIRGTFGPGEPPSTDVDFFFTSTPGPWEYYGLGSSPGRVHCFFAQHYVDLAGLNVAKMGLQLLASSIQVPQSWLITQNAPAIPWVGKCQRVILVSSSPLFTDTSNRTTAITSMLDNIAGGDYPTFSRMEDERYYLGSWATIPYGLVTTYSSNNGANINLEGWLSKFSEESIGSDAPMASEKLYFTVMYLLRENDTFTPPGPPVDMGSVYIPDLRIVLNAQVYKTSSVEWLSLLERSNVQYDKNLVP